jgi:hypothetical protein
MDAISSDESKRLGKPKVDLATPKTAKSGGLKTAAQNVADDEAAEGKNREALASPTKINFDR